MGMIDTDGDGIADTKQELIAPTTDPSKEAPGTPQFIGTWSLEYALIFWFYKLGIWIDILIPLGFRTFVFSKFLKCQP